MQEMLFAFFIFVYEPLSVLIPLHRNMNPVSPTFDLFLYLCFVDFIGDTKHGRGDP